MASLTPGVLSKLLENGGKKVTAPHRKALLQVTEIVPRLSDEGWQSRGYFLKLSDSLHCAYVSVSDHDADLICAGNLQLGQFVYVTHLDSASPVPLVRGLNPLPKRRPCVGNPTDLVSTDSLHEDKKCRAFVDTRRFSLDSSRRVWDHSPPPKPNKTAFPSKLISKKDKSNFSSPNNVIEKKVSVKADSPVKSPTISISPLKSKNENLCPKLLTSTPPRKCAGTKSQCDGSVHSQLVKVPLTFKTWYDASASWEDLPTPLCNLGKHVVTRRNVAFSAAVRFLEETSATDTVIQCMCKFAELCQSCQTISAGSLVKKFLDLHLSLQRVTVVFDSLLAPLPETKQNSHPTQHCVVEDVFKVPTHKNAISWVQAAVGTQLSKFNLFETQGKNGVLNGEQCHYVVIDSSHGDINIKGSSAQNKQNRVTQANQLPNVNAKRLPASKRNRMVTRNKDADKPDQSKGSELKVVASLAEKLLIASREWFLKYLEESLSNEFGLKNEKNTEIACLLGQLKQVNLWFDKLLDGDEVDHRVEKLRKSLYRFLLEHVNSAVAAS